MTFYSILGTKYVLRALSCQFSGIDRDRAGGSIYTTRNR